MTDEETADMERFQSLGVITGKAVPDKERVETLFRALTAAFAGAAPHKGRDHRHHGGVSAEF